MSTAIKSPLAVLVAAVFITSLSACGAGSNDLSANVQTSTNGTTVVPGTSTSVTPTVDIPANGPTPDCAPENCGGLRIIDGNAEAWRADAPARAARGG